MKKIIVLLLIIFTTVYGCQPKPAETTPSINDLIGIANRSLKNGNMQEAGKAYARAIKEAESKNMAELPALYCDMAQLLSDEKEAGQAELYYKKAYDIYSRNPGKNASDLYTCKENLSETYTRMGMYDKEQLLDKEFMVLLAGAVEKDPQNPYLRLILGNSLVDKTKYKEAADVFEKMLSLNIPPELKAEVLIDLAQAKRILNKFNLGVVGVDKFALKTGLNDLEEAGNIIGTIKNPVERGRLRMLLGEEYYERIDPDPEERRAEEGLETGTTPEYEKFRDSMIAFSEKNLRLALNSLNNDEDLMDMLRTSLHLARVLVLSGRPVDARAEMNRTYDLISKVPGLSDRVSLYFIAAEGYLLLAETTGKKEDRDSAVSPLLKVIELDPNGKDALQAQTCLARLYMVDGDLSDALKALADANEIMKKRAGSKEGGDISDEWVFGMIILALDRSVITGSRDDQSSLYGRLRSSMDRLNELVRDGRYAEATKTVDNILAEIVSERDGK
ncbi:MAG: hypothetical protein M1269_08310 [Chloroflexi bacterium]|nr:hypothetical protein [Chloroflexota bacterium]